MQPDPAQATAEELLAHAAWVQRLARVLAGPSDAEDVAQETWLAALRQPPRTHRPLKPWLARVVRNFALKARRGKAHRQESEELAARPIRSPSSAALVERLELERELVEALQALEEPYRSTVILRYLDGRSAASIAAELGIPARTVRWRLKRGLDELRLRLDRRHGGDRRAWSLAMIALARPSLITGELAPVSITAGGLSAWQGALAMNGMLKLAGAVAIAVTAAVGFWAVERSEDGIEPAERALASEPPPPALAPIPTEMRDTAEEREVAPAREAAREPVARAAPREAVANARARLEARLIDASGHALAGATLALHGDHSDSVETGSDGRAALEVELEGNAWSGSCEARSPGFASLFQSVVLERGGTTRLGEIVLVPGGSVSGFVLGPDARPFSDARVLVTAPEVFGGLELARRRGPSTFPGVPSARTKPDGRFRIDGVTPGMVRVWAGGADLRFAVTPPIEIRANEEHGELVLELEELERDERIEGTVVRPDGSPIPNADVQFSYRTNSSGEAGDIRADGDGHFRLLVHSKVPHDLTASDPEHRWLDASALQVPPGTLDLVLAFRESRVLSLTAHDPSGRSVDRFGVELKDSSGERRIELLPDGERPLGQALLRVPGESFKVTVLAEGFDLAELGPFEPESAPATLDVRLAPLPGIQGRVVRGEDPVAGARVIAYESAAPKRDVEHSGFPARYVPAFQHGSEPSASSDSEGRFLLTLRKSGRFYLYIEDGGRAPGEFGPFEFDHRAGLRGVEIRLPAGGAIEGRVLMPPGRNPEGVIVGANRGDLRPRTQRVGLDGRFRFEGLAPGRWQVERRERELAEGAGGWSMTTVDREVEFGWSCEVREGATTKFDLDLSEERRCTLRGKLVIDGQPAKAWIAQLQVPGKASLANRLPGSALDAQGEFAVSTDKPGTYELVLQSPPEQGEESSLGQRVELTSGDKQWSATLHTGQISGTSPPGTDAPVMLTLQCEDGIWVHAIVAPDAAGRFGPLSLPAGKLEVKRLESDGANGMTWKALRQEELQPGGTLVLELP
jgi:RNA polymerase sigma factor (sigma-70 family)